MSRRPGMWRGVRGHDSNAMNRWGREPSRCLPVNGVVGYTVIHRGVRHPGTMRRTERAARWWRASRYLMIEGVAAVVSFALVITGFVIVSLMILAVGWLMAPAYLRLVRFWAGRARLRTERYTGTVVPEQYPRLGDSAGFGDVRRMLWAAPTRRDLAWLFLHAVGGFVTGLLAVVPPLAALDSLSSPFTGGPCPRILRWAVRSRSRRGGWRPRCCWSGSSTWCSPGG